MRGHEEASGTAYVPKDMMAEWAKKDPITRYENYLRKNFDYSDRQFSEHTRRLKEWFKTDLDKALVAEEPTFDENIERAAILLPNLSRALQRTYLLINWSKKSVL